MDDALLALLRSVDTPTVCNAIELVQGRRGFDAFTRGTMVCTDPATPIVGYAVTARISATAPPTEDAAIIRTRRMAYYKAMHDAPKPSVAVIEDLDHPHSIGAFWGELNATIHKAFGLSGTLTNGVVRDLGDLPEGYPILAGSLGPSHAFVHVREIGTPVRIHGLAISPGDLIHADRHGALVIPPDVLPALSEAIPRLQSIEAIVLAPARRPGFDFAAFTEAWAAFERARV